MLNFKHEILISLQSLNSDLRRSYCWSYAALCTSKVELKKFEYEELFAYAESLGLIPFSTAFDINSLDMLISLNSKFIKIASHSASNFPLVNQIDKGIPFFISLGALDKEETSYLIKNVLPPDRCIIMHCTSSYPCLAEDINLGTIPRLKGYGFTVGFSSHENGILASTAASAYGVHFIERHFTLSNESVGFDHSISLEPATFKQMVRESRIAFKYHTSRVDFNKSENAARSNYHSGLFAKSSIESGRLLKLDDFNVLQPLGDPVNSLTSLQFVTLLEPRLQKSLQAGEQLTRSHL